MENIEVLVSTMNKEINDISLFSQMKINTNAIIINQSDIFAHYKKKINQHTVKMYTFPERGVGLSRNNALMRSEADICLMADDDMRYVEGYEKIVEQAYIKYPNADFIIFNTRIHYSDRIEERVKKNGRVHLWNSLKYGTVTFSFKRKAIVKKNIFFSLLFGGGAKYSTGEDSLFLWTAIKKGLKVYSEKTIIADVYNYNSTCFQGYNEKFYVDKGALFKAMEPIIYPLLNFQLVLRRRKQFKTKKKFFEILKIMKQGSKEMS